MEVQFMSDTHKTTQLTDFYLLLNLKSSAKYALIDWQPGQGVPPPSG